MSSLHHPTKSAASSHINVETLGQRPWLNRQRRQRRLLTMGFYAEWILPALIDLSMRNKRLHPYRERVAGAAEGRVLDLGIGSGLNLPFYARQVGEIFGLDPSPRLLARARSKTQGM